MFATPRIGANSRSCAKSNGDATAAIELTGRSGRAATANNDMMPPRHHPTTCTGCPPLSALTAAIALGSTSWTQCSSPRSRSLNAIEP
jgi:hypothetical protein